MKHLPQQVETPPTLMRAQIQKFRAASKAQETKRALDKNWRAFENWCSAFGVAPFPCLPETLEAYLVHLADRGLRPASIDQARWAINARHKLSELPAPGDTERVKVVMAGIKRTIGSRQSQKAALTIEHIRQIPFRVDLIGKRDKALLLMGFAAGLRRSELADVRAEDLEGVPQGIRIHLQRSKKNQEGKNEWVDIVPSISPHCCPVKSLDEWQEASGITVGPLFPSINRWEQLGNKLSTVSIGKIVKWAASCCGMDPAQFGGHSLRAGCATYLLDKGVPLNVVAKQGRWKKYDSVLRYDRNATGKALKGVY